MKARLSFRDLIALLYLGSLVPLLIMVGLVVYRMQQNYLITDARDRLTQFVQADVTNLTPNADLTNLAVQLSERLRVLGADVFVQDSAGRPVPPALGTGPWLDGTAQRKARETRLGSLQTISIGSSHRLVYQAPILNSQGNLLGTVEASLPLDTIEHELAGLRLQLTWILGVTAIIGVLVSFIIAGTSIRQLEGLLRTSREVAQGKLTNRAPLPEVSEVRLLAQTFNEMLDRIQASLDHQAQLNDEMRRFASDASHELRSPLAVLRNGLDMVEQARLHGDEAQGREIVNMMSSEVDSMAALVDDMLFLARIDHAAEHVENQPSRIPVAPLPLLEEVYERAQVLAGGQILQMEWPIHSISPLQADREMIRRALNNLVENALHHTPAGCEIRLRVEADAQTCRWIVEDRGSGIQPDELTHIFERFYRGDPSRGQGASTGLGLPIVAAIARAHGGSVRAASRPGDGATFILELPYSF